MELRLSVVRVNVKRGTEGGVSRENVELRKLAMVLVLCDAMVAKSMSKLCLVLKGSYPMSQLT